MGCRCGREAWARAGGRFAWAGDGAAYTASGERAELDSLRWRRMWHAYPCSGHGRLAEVDASFESPPILSHGSLYLTTPFDVVRAGCEDRQAAAHGRVRRCTHRPHRVPRRFGGCVRVAKLADGFDEGVTSWAAVQISRSSRADGARPWHRIARSVFQHVSPAALLTGSSAFQADDKQREKRPPTTKR